MDFHTLTGTIGVTLLLTAYVLLQLKKIKAQDISYASLNFIGAALAMCSSYGIGFFPFVILEGVWALVSLRMIILRLKNGY